MRIIRKVLFAVTGILGASLGVLTTLLANWAFNIGLSFPAAFFYGLVGGLLAGWLIAIYVSMVLTKYIRRQMTTKFGSFFSSANGFLRGRRF